MTSKVIDGVLLIDKASGMTSHDVVAIVRKQLGIKKVGHCGTLDPLATGLLMLTLGKGTKIQDLLMSEDKEYHGTMKLGEVTSSQDADGEIISTNPIPPLSKEKIREAFLKYQGDFYQTPPMVSAIKKEGVPLYKLARAGKTIEREPRFVHVYEHEILSIQPNSIEFRVFCSKGFYVRTYAHDIGQQLQCGAHLSNLRRTRSGRFSLKNAFPANLLKQTPPEKILQHLLTLPEVSRLRGI